MGRIHSVEIAEAASAPSGSPTHRPPTTGGSMAEEQVFDYIVVGGGSSGAAAAARLSEKNPRAQVALIEAGGRDDYPWIHIPIGYLYCIGNPRTDWLYRTPHPAPGAHPSQPRRPQPRIERGQRVERGRAGGEGEWGDRHRTHSFSRRAVSQSGPRWKIPRTITVRSVAQPTTS